MQLIQHNSISTRITLIFLTNLHIFIMSLVIVRLTKMIKRPSFLQIS